MFHPPESDVREIGALVRLLPLAVLLSACATIEAPQRVSTPVGADVALTTPPASSFKGYKPFREQEVGPWATSNDLVLRLGGWKAFASGQVPEIEPTADGSAGRRR